MADLHRRWHSWYRKFADSSPEVRALQCLEPRDLPEWAVQLRNQFPTVPPDGVEMCHARWLETLDRLLEDIGDGAFRRRAHWCGDLPPETVAGLGIRRRILIAWLAGVPRDKLMNELAEGLGTAPNIADLLYDVLGEVREAPPEVRQDLEFIADLFSGPYEAGNRPILAKWNARLGELQGRNSILATLHTEKYYPVLTNLCNYRTLGDVDRLIGMVSRQMLNPKLLGPCNMSLKFLAQDEPERLSASIAIVWALHRYASAEFAGELVTTPLGVRDQCNALLKRLGHSDHLRAWLAASLGFLVKKWVRRAWHIAGTRIPDDALPDFSFPTSPMVQNPENFEGVQLEASIELQRPVDRKDAIVASSGGKRTSKAPSLARKAPLPPGAEESGDPELSTTGTAAGPLSSVEADGDDDDGEESPDLTAPGEVQSGDDFDATALQAAGAEPMSESGESAGISTTAAQPGDSGAIPDAVPTDGSAVAEITPESIAQRAGVESPSDSEESATKSDADWDGAMTIGGTTRMVVKADAPRLPSSVSDSAAAENDSGNGTAES